MELSVINEIREETKQFNSLEEFDLYYQKHKESMDNHTTQFLNRVYKIKCADGNEYRITKKNCSKQDGKISGGDIYLKKVVKKSDNDNTINELMYTNVQADITNLRNELDRATNELNSILVEIDALKESVKTISESIAVIPDLKRALNEVVHVVNELTH